MATVTIPNRPVFRAQEVCELAEVQPYVLRTWEAEFPDLGFAKSANGPRVYRRADVARVLRIKDLLFVEGLTLAGARRKLVDEGTVADDEPVADADVAAMVDEQTRQHLRDVRHGLQWILGVLTSNGASRGDEFVLEAPHASPPSSKKAAPVKAGRAAKPPARAGGKAPKAAARKSGHKKR